VKAIPAGRYSANWFKIALEYAFKQGFDKALITSADWIDLQRGLLIYLIKHGTDSMNRTSITYPLLGMQPLLSRIIPGFLLGNENHVPDHIETRQRDAKKLLHLGAS